MSHIVIGYRHEGTPSQVAVTADQTLTKDCTDVRLANGGLLGWVYHSTELGGWIARTGYEGTDFSAHETQMEALRCAGGIS
jgi:hypothetical protein